MSQSPYLHPEFERRLSDIRSAIELVKSNDSTDSASVLDFLCDSIPWVLDYCLQLSERVRELGAELRDEADFRETQSARVVKLVELLIDVGPYVDRPDTLKGNIEYILAWTPVGQDEG